MKRFYTFLRIRILTICVLLSLAPLSSVAQLASLKPVDMVKSEVPNSGDKTFANIRINFSEPLEGVKVVRNNDAKPDDNNTNSPTVLYAQALSLPQHTAKTVTITHPDFIPCVITFSELGYKEPIKAGDTYDITVDVPSMTYVNANKAFAELDFSKALSLFNEYLENENSEYETSAQNKITLIHQLKTLSDFVNAHKNSSDITTQRKVYLAAKELYQKSGSWEAYKIYSELDKKLLPTRIGDEITGVSEMTIDSVWHDPVKDISAMSEKRLPLVNGENYYAQIMVEVGLDGVEFDGIEQFMPAERRQGIYYVYVPKGEEQAETFYIIHPDFQPLPVALKDYGIESVKGGRDYHIRINNPPRTIMEADRAFGSLDFNSALLLYADVLQNANLYDENVLQKTAQNIQNVENLVEEDYATDWNRIKTELNHTGLASREYLASKTDSLLNLATALKEKGVPGMDYNIKKYKERKDEYLHSVYIKLTAKELNSNNHVVIANGMEKPLELKSIWVEYQVNNNTIRQRLYASSPGEYSGYMPKAVSDWLSGHPGKSLKATIHSRKDINGVVFYPELRVRVGNKNELNLSIDRGDRSVSAIIYVENKK